MPTSENEAKIFAERLEAYKQRLIKESQRPPRPEKSREQRIQEQLTRNQVLLGKANKRRIELLLGQAKIKSSLGDYLTLHALAEEVAHLCRIELYGLAEVYPALPTSPPRMVSTLPPPAEEEPP